MTTDVAHGRPGRAWGIARVSAAVAVLGLALVILLHGLEPEYDPSWRMLSEYANGRYGALMSLAFLCLAASCVGAILALRREVGGPAGVVGLVFLAVAAIGMGLAAIFPMDPLTIEPSEATSSGAVHGLAAMLGIPGFPLGALLTSLGISRSSRLAGVKRWLVWLGLANLLIVVAMFVMVGIAMTSIGHFGPDAPIGWPNRLVMLGEYSWLIAATGFAARTRR